jgi:phosphoglycolate phosphatase
MEVNLFVFDLDGTLIDSERDLALAVNATRSNAGLDALPHDVIASHVGNGAPVLIRKSLGPQATEEQVQQGLAFFLDYYREHMLDHTRLYPGVEDGLRTLSQDCQLAVLTNKPERFSRMILEGLGVGGCFARIYGGNSFATKKPDPYGLSRIIRELATSKSRTLMVGDSAIDVHTARNAGVLSCGVTYGLQPHTLEDCPPDLLVDRFEDLIRWRANGLRHLHY